MYTCIYLYMYTHNDDTTNINVNINDIKKCNNSLNIVIIIVNIVLSFTKHTCIIIGIVTKCYTYTYI